MYSLVSTWIALVVSLGFIAAPANAAIIWTNGVDPNDPDSLNRMGWFDSATPGDIHWGPHTGLYDTLDGLEYLPDHSWYGVFGYFNQEYGKYLCSINSDGIVDPNSVKEMWPFDPNDLGLFMDISWDPVAEEMYGIYSYGGAGEPMVTKLYQINLETAEVSLVGTICYSDSRPLLPPGGLATTVGGVRYIDSMDAWLWELGPPEDGNDPQIPAERKWRERDPNGPFQNAFGGMTVDWSRDDGHFLYHVGYNLSTDATEFWTVDLTNGDATRVWSWGQDIILLCAAIDPVPEPSSLLVLAVPTIAMGWRRRG